MADSKENEVAKVFDFYEISGILAPGALFLFALSRIFPDSHFHIDTKELTLGDFGLFAILSYAAGHLIQLGGDILERLWWLCWEGYPSDWVRSGKNCFGQKLISDGQRTKLPQKIKELLGIDVDFSNITGSDWHGYFRQIYGIVAKAKLSQRVDSFNRTYGLLRGMASGCLIVALILFLKPDDGLNRATAAFLLGALVSLLRMHLFGRDYAREVYFQFLNITPDDLKPSPNNPGGAPQAAK